MQRWLADCYLQILSHKEDKMKVWFLEFFLWRDDDEEKEDPQVSIRLFL